MYDTLGNAASTAACVVMEATLATHANAANLALPI
jgi:hypothetical protein